MQSEEDTMGKKIIILNGSPRKSGNTSALTAQFTKGAEEAGNTVTEFFLGEMNINGCKGCFGGGKNPNYRNPKKESVLIMAALGSALPL